ncbi:MAG: Trk system potassium transporter TrkA [Pseudomonadota bacterium]
MNIIILGAGQVGSSLAETLSHEKMDITVVDSDPEKIRALQDRIDVRTVLGHASHPKTLRKAKAEDADMLIAVTSSDETNMIASQIAHTLYKVPKKIVRIRANEYSSFDQLFDESAIPIDAHISPEKVVTTYIKRLLTYPGALQVVDFANGKVRLVGTRVADDSPMTGKALNQLRNHIPNIDLRIAAIYRNNETLEITGDSVIHAGDEVFFIAASTHISRILHELRHSEKPYKRIVIAGGGNIGRGLAEKLERNFRVKIIDLSNARCEQLSHSLHDSTILCGSASDKALLEAENIHHADVFVAVTNDDEANIMSSLLAKKMGAHKVIALITNQAYVDLVQEGGIDIALSPQQITIGSLLRHVRKGDTSNAYSLRRGVAEAIEIVAHGDTKHSRVVGKEIDEIEWPKSVSIGAIVRNDEVIIAHHHIVIQPNDHVIMFLTNKKDVPELEKLFEVGFGFF